MNNNKKEHRPLKSVTTQTSITNRIIGDKAQELMGGYFRGNLDLNYIKEHFNDVEMVTCKDYEDMILEEWRWT